MSDTSGRLLKRHMGDFHFYQSNILTQRLYFYTSMAFHSSAEL